MTQAGHTNQNSPRNIDAQVKLITSPTNVQNQQASELIDRPSRELVSRDKTPLNAKSKKFNEFKTRSSSVMNSLKTPVAETKKLRALINNDANLIND